MKGIGTITWPKINTKEFKQKQEKVIAKMVLPTAEAKKALKAFSVAMLKCRSVPAVGLKRKRRE